MPDTGALRHHHRSNNSISTFRSSHAVQFVMRMHRQLLWCVCVCVISSSIVALIARISTGIVCDGKQTSIGYEIHAFCARKHTQGRVLPENGTSSTVDDDEISDIKPHFAVMKCRNHPRKNDKRNAAANRPTDEDNSF